MYLDCGALTEKECVCGKSQKLPSTREHLLPHFPLSTADTLLYNFLLATINVLRISNNLGFFLVCTEYALFEVPCFLLQIHCFFSLWV